MSKDSQIVMQITGELWQKIAAAFISLLVTTFSIWFTFCVIWPDRYKSADNLAGKPPEQRALWLLCSIGIGVLGFWIWWATAKYRAYVTDEGVGQTDGFRHVFVPWDRIHSYTMERIPVSRQGFIEPVLRDAQRSVLLRPKLPVIVYTTSHAKEERARFWRYVTNMIDRNTNA